MSKALITIGGIGTIVAVSGVFLYLAWVAWPLFLPAKVVSEQTLDLPWKGEPLHVAVGEYQSMGWALKPDGALDTFHIDSEKPIESRRLFSGDEQITAASFAVDGAEHVVLGFADGAVRLGTIGFHSEFLSDERVDERLRELEPRKTAVMEGGVVQRTPQGQFRLEKLEAKFGEPIKVADGPIRLIRHFATTDQGELSGRQEKRFVYWAENGAFQFCEVEEKENFLTGEVTAEVKSYDMPAPLRDDAPLDLVMTGKGDNVLLAWEDGACVRYDTRKPAEAKIVEELSVLQAPDARLTVFQLLLGQETVICGDSAGNLDAWFRVRRGETDSLDGLELTHIHKLPSSASAVTALANSQRGRMLAAGYENGDVRLVYVTTESMMLHRSLPGGAPVRQLAIAPRDDAYLAASSDSLSFTGVDPRHPEVTMASLFLPVWYEGYSEPRHLWQSSFSGVGPEMKLGLWPLVFGTLKATFYTMLFGAPLALLAAVYTSEFLSASWRSKLKPSIEMMASLPSVVLGFLAALVFAPIVEHIVPAALVSFALVPFCFLLGAFLWMLLPYKTAMRLRSWRPLAFGVAFIVGLLASYQVAPLVESLLFAGDLKRWLNEHHQQGNFGSPIGGWMLLFLPLSALLMAVVSGMAVNPWLRVKSEGMSRRKFGLFNLAKFLALVCLTFVVAYLLSWTLSAAGFDPRGTYVDTYVQRNALVVGFVMGFAVIPIIYTLADDALTAVPSHLRSASLGCGATPWQTAFKIVIPTAMSGLFSALMIGLGRAVGETMIVLMAGGNTPIQEWNIFSGFRTLAANLAVELPEAVKDSTHYRTLFFAALVLFLMTFVVNTFAEMVRLRFRKRAYQL